MIDNVDSALDMTRELKQFGCKISLDDFGTGYSSLLHLQSLPFDELKVDRSFVKSMTDRREPQDCRGSRRARSEPWPANCRRRDRDPGTG